MVHTSKSGLLPAPKKFIGSNEKKTEPRLEFQSCIKPVKFTLKPYSALLSPYRHGCSILCNHPTTNVELRKAIKRPNRKKVESEDYGVDKKQLADRVGEVLEEMLLSRYRRDERTINRSGAAVEEIASSSPDEIQSEDKSSSNNVQRTVLVLDLRRTASQETIATREGRETSGEARSPIISPAQSSLSVASQSLTFVAKSPLTPQTNIEQRQEGGIETIKEGTTVTTDDAATGDETDVQRRRGKVRKKKKSGKSITVLPEDRGSKEVIGLIEPGETQVSACNESGADDYRSGQTSATPGEGGIVSSSGLGGADGQHPERLLPISDLFDQKTLRHLRRTVTVYDAEAHFRSIWRKVLEEATIVSNVTPEEEMKHVKEKVKIEPSAPENWIEYPRAFVYSRTRFDLPINKDKLNGMTPLEYLKDYVAISKRHNLLYEYVFEKYREYVVTKKLEEEEEISQIVEESGKPDEQEIVEVKEDMENNVGQVATSPAEVLNIEGELNNQLNTVDNIQVAELPQERERFILGKNILPALGEVMSRPFSEVEANKFREMVNWSEQDIIDLRTWIGLCALSERVFGYQFSSGEDRDLGKQQVIERVDFENLLTKLPRLNLRPDLLLLLTEIQEACERNSSNNDVTVNVYCCPSVNGVEEGRPRIGVLDDDEDEADDEEVGSNGCLTTTDERPEQDESFLQDIEMEVLCIEAE